MYKNFMRKVILFMLIFSCLIYPAYAKDFGEGRFAPLSPEFLEWRRQQEEASSIPHNDNGTSDEVPNYGEYEGGYVPFPVDLSHLAKNPPVEINESPVHDDNATPSSKFDLRDSGRITEIKNQSPYGTCWTFAAMAAMESNYLTQGGPALDLAEMHLAWYSFRNSDKSKAFYDMNKANFDTVMKHGGNSWYPTALYSRLDGPVPESEVPYGSGKQPSAATPESYTRALRLRDVYYLSYNGDFRVNDDNTNRNIIKQRVMDTGAVSVSYQNDVQHYNETDAGGTAFYSTVTGKTNHAVNIIGWDDNYSRENFATKPKSNGAWLIRNSWGNKWSNTKKNVGDDGYFWMSYEQYLVHGTAYIVEPVDTNLKAYYYDALGWTGSYGWQNNTDSYAANVFKAERANERLTEVGIYVPDNNFQYELRVYTNLGTTMPSKPVTNNYTLRQSGTITYAGYHTITLNSPVPLAQNQYFSVVLVLKNTNMIPVERVVSGYTPNAKIEDGSFFSPDGETWTTGSNAKANACIKAFTVTGTAAPSAPAIISSNPTTGRTGQPYSYQYSAIGNPTPTWKLESGTLPNGLTLSSTGLLAGTPTEKGTYTFSVTASNSQGEKTITSTMDIVTLPSITTTQFSGYEGEAFSTTLRLSDSTPATWSVIGSLPDGLTLNANTGVISGKPKRGGTYTPTICATTLGGTVSTRATFTIAGKPEKPAIKTASMPSGTIGQPYNEAITYTGTNPVTLSITGLPNGLTLNPSTGNISGTPTEAGKYTLKVTASNIATTLSGKAVTKNIKLEISALPPKISYPAAFAPGNVGEKYNDVQCAASAGTPPLKWTASGLPSGLKINSNGLITGTPKKAGTFKVKLKVQNSAGKDESELELIVWQKPEIVTKKLADATTDKSYTAKITAKGSTPITWDVSGLPNTLTFTVTKADGTAATITGTPTEIAKYSADLTAVNSAGRDRAILPLTVKGIAPKLKASLAKGTVGSSYLGSNISATGSRPIEIEYSISASDAKKFGINDLSDLGLSFRNNPEGGTAVITGIPTRSIKSLPITFTAKNAVKSISAKKTLTIAGEKPVFVEPVEVKYTRSMGSDFSLDFRVTGTKDITFSVGSGNNFTLQQTGDYTATLTGKLPEKATSITVSVIAQNYDGKVAKKITITTRRDADTKSAPPKNVGAVPEVIADKESQEAVEQVQEISQPIIRNDTSASVPVITFGSDRTALSLRLTERELLEREGYVIAEILPEVSVSESGMHDIEIELDESVEAGAKLFWFAFPKDAPSSEDDEIVEFYDEAGAEIEDVPENRIITVSAWFNQGVTYAPVIAVK